MGADSELVLPAVPGAEGEVPAPIAAQWCDELLARVQPGGLSLAPVPSDARRVLGDKYTLGERIGSGGVGEVWRGRNEDIGRDVAVKLLRPSAAGDDTARARFVREARLASAVRHPGVVDVLDYGITAAEQPYIVMELLEGESLAARLQRLGRFAWQGAVEACLELADALQHAHARGVVHRDLKPSNVMLVRRDPDAAPRCVVIDFGMAKGQRIDGADATVTATGQVFGSPAYMSPEQFKGAPADERSDVYALGCVLYELLVGRRPFDGAGPAELMYQHLFEAVPTLPDGVAPRGAHAQLRHVIRTACHKDPARRFADMDGFAVALRRVGMGRSHAPRWLGAGAVAVGLAGVAALAQPGEPRGPVDDVAEASVVPPEPTPVPGPLATAEPQRTAAIYASKMFSCALSERGALQCWGKTGSYFGRPGRVGHVGDDELPSDVPPLDFGGRAVVDLAVSYWSTHLCALLDDGSARCWGDNGEGQLGAGPGVGDLGDAAGESPGNAPALPLENIRSLHTQVGWTCALTGAADASEARCWGRNDFGQLGQGHKRPLSSPPPLPIDFGERTPVQLSMGLYHGCAVLDDGSARCWGSNGKHQLGNGLPISVYVGDGVGEGAAAGTERPNTNVFDVSGLGELDASLVRANGGWACVLTSDDRVRCWGGNKRGTLGYRWDQIEGCTADGLGDSCKVLTASTDVDLGEHGGSHLVDLQQGRQRACVLDDAGAVRCWGHASNGALGYGAALEAAAPAGFIGHRTSPAEVYAALGTDGVVDIGDADGDGAIDRVTQLAVGYDHVCVLVADGSVRCWGGNDYGQLGYGTLQDVGDDETPAEFYAEHGDGAVSLWPAD